MGFVQIIELRSSRPDDIQKVADEWESATEGKRKTVRRVVCQDHDDPGRLFIIVFFNSYEEAMQNSALPETELFSRKMMSYADGAPTFSNLDIQDDRSS
jgi:hypothetical protein